MKVSRGDLVEVKLHGADGSEIRKKRPAIVIQNDTGNKFSPVTIVAPCTSGDEVQYPVEVHLSPDSEPVDNDSLVLCGQIRTVDVEKRITRKFGTISETKMRKIDRALRISLGL